MCFANHGKNTGTHNPWVYTHTYTQCPSYQHAHTQRKPHGKVIQHLKQHSLIEGILAYPCMALSHCGGLNEHGPHRLIHLNAQSLDDGTAWEGLGGVALLGEVCHCTMEELCQVKSPSFGRCIQHTIPYPDFSCLLPRSSLVSTLEHPILTFPQPARSSLGPTSSAPP